jgi:UPF0755 protein
MSTDDQPKKRNIWVRALYFVWIGLLYAVCLVALGGAVTAFAGYIVYDHVTRPGYAGDPVDVKIPEGVTGAKAGEILAEAGLLEYPWLMRAAIAVDSRRPVDPDRASGQIKFGAYVIPKGNSPTEILYRLYEGPTGSFRAEEVPDDLRVTIPEGLSTQQIAGLLAEEGTTFLEVVSDASLIESLEVEASTLEGFLMPNTYFFTEKPTGRAIALRMFDQFKREYANLLEAIPDAADRPLLELMTVASIVEEEARIEEERAIVASVIYNRLERGIALQMDSTLQFALNKYGQRMLNEDTEVQSPYNTYRHKGLPPGPISNPGVASIRAALQPADTKYLYFVSSADGKSHAFSETLAQHNRAVARYNREIAEQRRTENAAQ